MVQIIKFSAEWCNPCKIYDPIFDRLAKEFKDVKFTKIDVDKNPDVARDYNIVSIPTTIIIKNNKLVDSVVGLCSENELRNKIEGWQEL